MATDTELQQLRRYLAAAERDFLADLERLVNIDCGTYTKPGVDEAGRWLAERLRELGADVEVVPHDTLGDTIVATFGGSRGGPRLLLIGHLDTVFPAGTVAERPFTVRDGRAYGPGVSDMKGGLLAGLYALRALHSLGGQRLPFERLVFVANPDEEIASPFSSDIIRREAARSDAALVLEGARANGDIVSARKGVLDVWVTVQGRAAHAGVEPEKGRSAIVEAAHKTLVLHALNDRWPDVTVNVGVVRGGSRTNVVAESATLQVDVRAATRETMDAALEAVHEIGRGNTVPDTTCVVEVRNGFWPLEKLEESGGLVAHAVDIAGRLGFELKDAATGGASDANTTAAVGVPTLDGLGPIGGLDHSPDEYLELDSIVPRTTLLAGLMLAVARDPAYRRDSAS